MTKQDEIISQLYNNASAMHFMAEKACANNDVNAVMFYVNEERKFYVLAQLIERQFSHYLT